MEILKEAIRSDTVFNTVCEFYEKGRTPILVNGVCEAVRPLFCFAFAESAGKKPVIITADEKQAYSMAERLGVFTEGVLFLPSRDFIFDNISAHSKDFEQERISVLTQLLKGNYSALVTVPEALAQYTVSRSFLEKSIFEININSKINIDSLAEKLVSSGYTKAETVEGAGQFSKRGGILDVFSPFEEYACRFDFFGDEIDSMGIFDTVTQRRIENNEKYICIPVNELMAGAEELAVIEKEAKRLAALCEDKKIKSELYQEAEQASGGNLPNAKDKYFSLIYKEKETAFDYLKDTVLIILDSKKVLERFRGTLWQYRQTIEQLTESGRAAYKNAEVMMSENEFTANISDNTAVLDYFPESKGILPYASQFEIATKSLKGWQNNIEMLTEDLSAYLASKRKILYLADNERAMVNIIDILNDKSISAVHFNGEVYSSVVSVDIMPTAVMEGFELPNAGFILATESQNAKAAIGKLKKHRQYKFKKGERIATYGDLSTGDYVVHANHGIGVYTGLQTLISEGITKDYIKIQYAGADVLYVPCNQLDLVSKYIGAGSEANIRLSKMGTSEWQRAKARTKSAAKNIAKELIALYAERSKRKGFAFAKDSEYQDEFEAMFEYSETEGQLTASSEIKHDMEKEVPMDRLLCGDVGFGKTEVAIRAAFKCVNECKQTAVLVPTTILAMQHFRTFTSRFRGFPVRIEMLSRFVSLKDQKKILADLKSGKIDIIIGTHKILQKNMEFYDLGLLVVDEEQRFGVTHKERLKTLAANVDVLTLTATPIPRTLNMALAGIRDMSVLEEAPHDRIPVQSYVLEHDEEILNEAIRKELRRGGQVFYLHNIIDSIYTKAAKISECFENAVVGIAHGRMDKEELSEIWQNMVDGNIDILVCTTIIETGIDIPNANTLIIEDSNRMGLSQLHQIRGRVGRSPRKAYAYFTYRRGSLLTEIASKRLSAIREFTEFGSGFKIAMRDLEIRGAGNLLGAEQSGHMESVGYDLYIKILAEAVNEEKGITVKSKKDCLVEISADAYIPEDYIASARQRIDIYRKIALIDDKEDEDEITDELLDRFGEIPSSLKNLIDVSLSRNMASLNGIRKITQNGGTVAFYTETLDPRVCAELAGEAALKGSVMVSAGAKPHFAYRLKKGEETISAVKRVLNIYTKLTQKQYGQTAENDV